MLLVQVQCENSLSYELFENVLFQIGNPTKCFMVVFFFGMTWRWYSEKLVGDSIDTVVCSIKS